jgi:hypothetical protein
MGACLVKGLNNWDRVWTYRREWAAGRQEPPSEPEWKQEFKQLLARRELYQDRLVILSDGPYSGVDAGDLGLGTAQWKADSLAIRREHELAHYFVYRVFGSLRQNVQDELIADFVGLVRAYGRYRPEMALRFLGLERFPRTRADGRIENYRGDPALSDPAMAVVRCLAHRAAANLGRLSDREGDELKAPSRLARITLTLAGLSLDQLAADDFLERLDAPSRG